MIGKLALSAVVLILGSFAVQAQPEETIADAQSTSGKGGVSLYFGGAYAHSWTDIDSGGTNTQGPHDNFDCTGPVDALNCDDTDDASGGSLFFGIGNLFNFGKHVSMRGEIEYSYRDGGDYVTGSFDGTQPPTFVYSTTVSEYHTAFLNAEFDFTIPNSRFAVYAGGGVGASRSDVATDDTIVSGEASDTSFAFNIAGGVIYEAFNRMSIFSDVRLVDLGHTDLPIFLTGSDETAGEYTVDHRSTEIRIGVIYKLGKM